MEVDLVQAACRGGVDKEVHAFMHAACSQWMEKSPELEAVAANQLGICII